MIFIYFVVPKKEVHHEQSEGEFQFDIPLCEDKYTEENSMDSHVLRR